MSTEAQRKYTTNGFPVPYAEEIYDDQEIVWFFLGDKLPYWPAQIKKGTDRQRMHVLTFNDPGPDSSVVTHRERQCDPKRILKWNVKRQDGREIGFLDVAREYLQRMKLSTVDDIEEYIWKQWNGKAIDYAQKEMRRLFDLSQLEARKKADEQERAELAQAIAEEKAKEESMKNQMYDGRNWNESTNEKEGFELRVGDRIRYWPEYTIANSNKPITTTIFKLYNKYDTLRLKDTVPVVVGTSGNPPFWNTEIQKINPDGNDEMNPIFYPLNQCKFYPGELENNVEIEHLKGREEFKKDLRSKGWRSMMWNSSKEESVDSDFIHVLRQRSTTEGNVCSNDFDIIPTLNDIGNSRGYNPFECNQCGKSFKYNSKLKEHIRTHSGDKPYKCDECNKSFKYSHNLKTHKRIHSGERPFKCDECNKSFVQNSNLKTHKRTHTGERPYKCDGCNKSFTTNGNLKKHMRIHSGDKPYRCDECNKSFARSDHLKIHKRKHSGEKPFECSKCSKKFVDSSNRNAHQKKYCKK